MRTLAWIVVLAVASAATAAEWPQWRGPNRDGHSKEAGLAKEWPKNGPALVATSKLAGLGYSSPAVIGSRVYVPGARDKVEYLIALDDAGKELWASKIGPAFDFDGNSWSFGPNGGPTVDGEHIFTLGSQGILVCVDTKGKEVWRKDLRTELAAEVNPIGGGPEKMGWGFSCSPLVDGEHLIITPGGPKGLVAALDKKSGALVWQSKNAPDQCTYASPMAAEIGGVRQYIAMTPTGVVGVAAKDGALLWRHKRETPYPDVVCPTPVVKDNLIFVTVGRTGGCELIKITGGNGAFKAESVYTSREMSNRQGDVILVDGFVYGFHEDRVWKCLDFMTGDVKWDSGRRGLKGGSMLYADGRLYCLTEDLGEVAMIATTPTKYTELSRFKLPETSTERRSSGRIWTHPVLADGLLYLRDQELVFCYKVK